MDLVTKSSTQRVGDRGAQVTLDLVLDEAARDRQQRKPLDDGERLDKVQPGSLLRSEGSGEGGASVRDAVSVEFPVEFGDDRIPHRGKAGSGIIGQRRIPWSDIEVQLSANSKLSTWLSTVVERTVDYVP
ncbi:hypothetical protein NIIDMKKI_76630 [Mycobacterium kansasii]|uniref:Uncharacterized protein n=1 Tax=Mycobacterium kansasii TaxID=1768 RepID=A0A7G1INM9_MYCKA|nr:hypothetical protein NIIDMKKI_76630 [Mycobacterium kansasii]